MQPMRACATERGGEGECKGRRQMVDGRRGDGDMGSIGRECDCWMGDDIGDGTWQVKEVNGGCVFCTCLG